MKKVLGFALTGSFCTLGKAFQIMEELSQDWQIIPILSESVARTDTRFYSCEAVCERIRSICKMEPLKTIPDTEPLGPGKVLDLLLICPCTGNTLSKLAHGITDTSVTMAAKSHRRQGGKILIALSTNDALSGSAVGLGTLLDKKNYYFVPLHQDDAESKPSSLQCDFSLVGKAAEAALEARNAKP